MTTAASPKQITGLTNETSDGGLFGEVAVNGISNLIAADVTAAQTAATNAAASAASAATSFDNFDDRYLGQKASDPSQDNDNNSLLTGALYFNTSSNTLKVYSGSAWQATTPTSSEQTNINALAQSAVITDMDLLATSSNITNMDTLGASGVVGNIATVAGVASNVTTVAGISSNVTSVANNATNINAVQSNATNINTVAGNNTNISTVAGIDSNITTVAGVASNVTTVAGISSNVTTVANNNSNVTTVAGSNANINTVAGSISNVNTVAGSISNVNSVASNSTNINAVNSNSANINTVAGIDSNVTTVATNSSTINSVSGLISGTQTFTVTVTNPGSGNVFVIDGSNNPTLTLIRGFTYTFDVSDNTVSGHPLAFKNGSSAYTTGVTVNGTAGQSGATVVFAVPSNAPATGLLYYCTSHGNAMGNSITTTQNDIATVVANISGINNFVDRYRVASSAPTSSLDVGDLYFDTSSNELKVYKATGWANPVADLNATNLSSGTIPDARFPSTLPAISGANLTNLDATDLASGTIPDARFPNTLPAISGANLTNLDATDLTGTIASARISGSYTGITGTGALNAGSITSGFGSIDTGSSNITTTGVGTFGSLDISGDVDVDGTLEADAITVNGTALSSVISGTTVSNATLASTVTVADSNANTNFPVVFHDESNGLLDDTGALRYNPSTGELLVPKLTVSGTTTTVDTITMNAANAIIFEGATADANETTLTIVDPTADRTINLPNQSGTIPVLAVASNTAITATPEELNILDGVTASATDINLIDGITNGTVIASKAIITDSNKDISGGRNITITGELDAASLDISGDADIDGTLEADAITVNGTTLNSVIQNEATALAIALG